MKRILVSISLALALAGCGTTVRYMQTNTPPKQMAKRSPQSVQFYTGSMPTVPFLEVGLIEAQQQGQLSVDSPETVLWKLREKAAEIGCDGVLVRSENAVVGSSGQYGSTSTLRGYAGTCIVYQ